MPVAMLTTNLRDATLPRPDGVEDAIHHDGRFYSVTYTGRVEAWQRNDETGEFTSQVVAPALAATADDEKKHLRRRYLAASTDGRLMAVLKHTEGRRWSKRGGTRT